MTQTRYCSTCGALLSQEAAICGECGARYQESPYERRATDAPGAWAQAPRARNRDLGQEEQAAPGEDGIELISRDALQPKAPGATALRPQEQYDQMMVTQPPSNVPGQSSASGAPAATGSSRVTDGASATSGAVEMEPPLDGCTPATPLKRFLAALVDGVIATVILIPLTIGLILAITQDTVGLLASILVGVGAPLPGAYAVLMIWLQGAKGFTLGKLIFGLRTTRLTEGGPIGLLRSLGRWFLYGLASLIMALSIFLDPKKLLRGFHDRAVDSVVVDIKTGRNPMKPRPDDFERHSAEHYLGSSSVAVTTHENLLATPGAAWTGQDASSASSDAQNEPAQAESWGAGPGAASPYAPPPQDSAGDNGWAPPEIPDLAPPPSAGQPWGAPEQPSVQQPSAPSAPQQWDAPAPQQWHGHAPEQAAPQQWDAPAPEQQWQAPAPEASSEQQWQAPAEGVPADAQQWQMPAPSSQAEAPQQVPAEHTADAWVGGDIDEQTRVVLAEQDDLGDLEQTRVSAAAPRIPKVTLRADDGTERVVSSPVVIGRNPSTGDGEVQFVLKDETRSMSKTHLRLDGTGTDITVTDLGSTNGSAIVRADGSRESLVPNTPTVLPEGATLTLGDRSMTVERDS